MAPFVLLACGSFIAGYGVWRSWSNGRRLLLPLARTSEGSVGRSPTPPRGPAAWRDMRHVAWQLALAVGWLMLAMLGLFMVTVALGTRA